MFGGLWWHRGYEGKDIWQTAVSILFWAQVLSPACSVQSDVPWVAWNTARTCSSPKMLFHFSTVQHANHHQILGASDSHCDVHWENQLQPHYLRGLISFRELGILCEQSRLLSGQWTGAAEAKAPQWAACLGPGKGPVTGEPTTVSLGTGPPG